MLSVLKDTHTPPVQVQQVQANARFCALESINHFIDCEHFRSQAIFRAIHKNFGTAHRLEGNIFHIRMESSCYWIFAGVRYVYHDYSSEDRASSLLPPNPACVLWYREWGYLDFL
jgi:hypothetical protein